MAESEQEQHLRHKVERLVHQREQGNKTQHNIIGMGIGLAIYSLSGFTGTGALIGIVVAVVYLISTKSFF